MSNTKHNLTEEEIEEYKESFNMFDKDGNGTITASELKEMLNRLGEKLTEEEIEQIINSVDDDHSGTIDFDEFITLYNNQVKKMTIEEELRGAFKRFDANGDGFISVPELQEMMSTLGQLMTKDEIDQMIQAADVNGDGQVDFEEFVTLLTGK